MIGIGKRCKNWPLKYFLSKLSKINTVIFEPVVGSGPGAGMGLVLVVTGIIILFVTLGVYGSAAVRQLELRLPDYEAIAAD